MVAYTKPRVASSACQQVQRQVGEILRFLTCAKAKTDRENLSEATPIKGKNCSMCRTYNMSGTSERWPLLAVQGGMAPTSKTNGCQRPMNTPTPPPRPHERFIFSPKGEHVAEIASMKDEVSRKLPWIAEKAVSEAGRQWQKRANEETAAVRTERDRRLREFQVQDIPRGTAFPRAMKSNTQR